MQIENPCPGDNLIKTINVKIYFTYSTCQITYIFFQLLCVFIWTISVGMAGIISCKWILNAENPVFTLIYELYIKFRSRNSRNSFINVNFNITVTLSNTHKFNAFIIILFIRGTILIVLIILRLHNCSSCVIRRNNKFRYWV